jgi:hypothetical protein
MTLSIVTLRLITPSISTMKTVSITTLRGQFVEQKLMLSSSFGCNQIQNCHRYDIVQILLCYFRLGCSTNPPQHNNAQNNYTQHNDTKLSETHKMTLSITTHRPMAHSITTHNLTTIT